MDRVALPEATLWRGCGDGSCVVRVQKGQHTNGGCRCHSLPNLRDTRMALQQVCLDREYFRGLAEELARWSRAVLAHEAGVPRYYEAREGLERVLGGI